jgi:hypothetical protein
LIVKLKTVRRSLEQLKFEHLCARSGPVCFSLDAVLTKHKITPQFYHSRAFIGNHCHKYLTCRIYEVLTTEVIKETNNFIQNQEILEKVVVIKKIFDEINESYRNIHILISHSKTISENSIASIESSIQTYINLFRKNFPGKTIPKQHILEAHCTDWIRLYGFGLGFHGEQRRGICTLNSK